MATLTMEAAPLGADVAVSERTLEDLCRAVGAEAAVVSTAMPCGNLQVCRRFNLPESAERRYVLQSGTDRLSWQAIMHGACVRQSDLEEPLIVGEGFAVVGAVRVESPVFAGYPGVITFFNRHARGTLKLEPAALASAVGRWTISTPLPMPPRQFVFDDRGTCLMPERWQAALSGPAATEVEAEVRRRAQAESICDASAARFNTHDANDRLISMQIVGPISVPGLSERPVLFVSLHPRIEDWKSLIPNAFAGDPELHRLTSAVTYMVANFRDGPTLRKIADAAHLSQFHFHRRFSELFGITPKSLLYDLQLSEAKRMLADASTSLVAIAKHCGFAHQSHFTSRFKQGTGITPTRWRRESMLRH